MDNRYRLIINSFGSELIKLDEPLSYHTALKAGGPAKLFFVATNTAQIVKMVSFAKSLKLPFLIFGTGTKLLIAPSGFDGVVIKNRTKNIAIVSVKGKVAKKGIGVDEATVEVEAGVTISSLVYFLEKQGLESSDIEGLPGSIGGNIFLSKTLQQRSEVIKVIEEGEVEQIRPNQLSLRRHIVLSVIFKFKVKRKP